MAKISAPKTIVVEYAADGDDDEEALLTIGFLGPSAVDELDKYLRLKIYTKIGDVRILLFI